MTVFSFRDYKRGEKMDMKQPVTARQLITQADKIRQDEIHITQAEWSRRAGFDEFGKLISNSFNRGNCKLSVFIQLLRPLGYELRIVKKEEEQHGDKPRV